MHKILSKTIQQKPQPIKQKSIDSSNNAIIEANDLYYKENKSLRGWTTWLIGLVLIVISSFLILFLKTDSVLSFVLGWMIMGLPGTVIFVYGFIAPQKTLVFDRQKGVITVAPRFQKSFDIPFDTGAGIIGFTHNETTGIDEHLSFSVSEKQKRKGGVISNVLVKDSWAFMVWYMDKNRPLPPGDAFDPYRERNFKRRRAAGFPAPLYPSAFNTREATTEQQEEREKIGGW